MICLSCDNDKFVELETVFEPNIKGKKTEIRAKAFICKNCATPIMDTAQMDVFLKLCREKDRES